MIADLSDPAMLLRLAHILGATVLMGTGAGIAFFMVMAQRSKDPTLIAHVAGIVVLADMLFTATAAIAQPITGVLLAWELGWSLTEPWLITGIGFIFLSACSGCPWCGSRSACGIWRERPQVRASPCQINITAFIAFGLPLAGLHLRRCWRSSG